MTPCNELERLFSAGRRGNVVPLILQDGREQEPHRRFIIHHQDTALWFSHLPDPPPEASPGWSCPPDPSARRESFRRAPP